MRRWLYRILIALGVLILLVVAGVQIIFWSSLPLKLAIPIAQRRLGMHVQAKSLSTGWFGHTTLTDVKLALPLADRSFLEVKRMKVSHTSVFGILFGRDIVVESVELDQPKLVVRQNDAGRWNLQEVEERIGRTSEGTPDQNASHSAPKLPEVTIRQAQVIVIPQSGGQANIEEVSVHGRPQGELLYLYEVKAPGHLESNGKLVPGGDWSHEISMDVQQVGDWVRPWIKQWPQPAMAKLKWRGHLANGGVAGRLTIEQSQAEQYSAKGVMSVFGGGAEVTARPEGLVIQGGSVPQLKLVGGSAGFRGGNVSLDGLQVSTSGGRVQLDGQYRLGNQSADLKAVWEQIQFPSAVSQSGTLEAELTTSWPNQPKLEVMLNSSGKMSAGRWDAKMKLSAQGRGWTRMDWHADFPTLAFYGRHTIELQNLSADLRTRGTTIRLDELELPGPGRVSGRGAIDLEKKTWWLWADGSNWVLPQANDAKVRFTLNTWGDDVQATVQQAFLEVGQLQLTARGNYVSTLPKPLNVDVYVEHLPRVGAVVEDRPPLLGKLWSQVHLNGTVAPLRVDLTGRLHGRDLRVYQRPVGDVTVELTGGINAERAEVHSTELKLLGGRWRFDAVYPEEEEALRVAVSVNDLPLQQATALAIDLPAQGTFNGSWTIDLPQLKPKWMEMEGNFHAKQVKAMGFAAQSVEGTMHLDDGVLAVGPVVMRQGEGLINARANLRLAEINKIHAQVTAAAWPVNSGQGRLEVWTNTALDLDLKEKTATGPLDLTAEASLGDKPLGKLALDAELRGRVVNLKQIGGDIFGGTLDGQGVVDIDKPMLAHGQLRWSAIDNDQVAAVFPMLQPLHGRFSGIVNIAPSEDRRALEPLRVTGTIKSDGGHFRELRIGSVSFLMFVGIADKYSAYRAVLEHFDLSAGGGIVNLWARAGKHEDGNLWAQANVSFADLDLNQLVHATQTSSKAMPGKLSGSLTAVGDPMDVRRVYVEGNGKLTDSDLANMPGFAQLYNTLHLALGPQTPGGQGRARFRIEGQTLSLLDARYFNRGVEAFASGSSSHVWAGKQAGLDYVIVGTARPLKNLDLPFMADLDSMLSVLQGALTTMRVTGTVDQPKVTPMAFDELGGDILGMILGEAKSPRTTAGR